MLKNVKNVKNTLHCIMIWLLVLLVGIIPLLIGFYFHDKISSNSAGVFSFLFGDILWVLFMFPFLFPSSNSGTDAEECFFVLMMAIVHISLLSIFLISYCNIDMFLHPELYLHEK